MWKNTTDKRISHYYAVIHFANLTIFQNIFILLPCGNAICIPSIIRRNMELDFITLYIIILLNSVGFALVWLIISGSYKSLQHAARYWFMALMMTCAGGPLLVIGENSLGWTYAGNILIISGFGLFWQGVRVFYNQKALWAVQGLLVSLVATAFILFGSRQAANNLIIATGQLFTVSLTVWTLLTKGQRQAGTWVASGAFGILVLGQGAEAITNILQLLNLLDADTYYQYAAWFLVSAIIGTSIANLGFLLMAVDQLKSDLQALAMRDELTGLPNRRALNARLPLIEKRAKRMQRPVTVLMMDLDKFKIINDNYGHFAGDHALKHLAETLQQSITLQGAHETGFLARIGGDEFCILIPDADLKTATKIAEKLARTIANTPFSWKHNRLTLSASIGLTHWSPSQGTSLSESLSDADNYLLQTKRNSPQPQEPFQITTYQSPLAKLA